MDAKPKKETVWINAKGRVVIPRRLRKEFQIEDGTYAVVTATTEGILICPVTATITPRARGILKRKPGQKTLAREWAAHKKQERKLEGAKHDASHA